jgi:hypothetical protein
MQAALEVEIYTALGRSCTHQTRKAQRTVPVTPETAKTPESTAMAPALEQPGPLAPYLHLFVKQTL